MLKPFQASKSECLLQTGRSLSWAAPTTAPPILGIRGYAEATAMGRYQPYSVAASKCGNVAQDF